MSALRAKTDEKFSIKKLLLPLYIIISLMFIVYVLYSYVMWTIYRWWMIKWQEQWYARAIQDLMSQAGSKCEPVALNFWKDQIDVVNVACLQKQENPQAEAQREDK